MSAPPLWSNGTTSLPLEFQIISTISQTSGALSLLMLLFPQLSQVFENHFNRSVSGVSCAFLFFWIGGDVANLRRYLTRAVSFKIGLGIYHCFIDFILGFQYWYYTRVYRRQTIHHDMLQSPSRKSSVDSGKSADSNQVRRNRFETSPHRDRSNRYRSDSSHRRRMKPRRSFFKSVLSASVLSNTLKRVNGHPIDIDSDTDSHTATDYASLLRNTVRTIYMEMKNYSAKLMNVMVLLGTYGGWISMVLHVSSRIPQIIKNFRAKSTAGVSPLLFLFALLGNSFYTISVTSHLYLLSKYDGSLGELKFHKLWIEQLPVLVGTFGTIIFDAFLLFQHWLYKDTHYTMESDPLLHKQRTKPKMFHSTDEIDSATRKDLHFTTPQWYTNNIQGRSDDNAFEEHQNTNSTEKDCDLAHQEHVDSSSFARDSYIINPPSRYVYSMSQKSDDVSKSVRTRGIANKFNGFARSFKNTPINVHNRASSVYSPGALDHYSAPTGTALLPHLVGSYSSISKKMGNDAKVPFSPIDFLHDDFLNRR